MAMLESMIMSQYAQKVETTDANVILSQRFVAVAQTDGEIVFKVKNTSSTTTMTVFAGQNIPISMYELVSTTAELIIGF
jgi:hypothetical protein